MSRLHSRSKARDFRSKARDSAGTQARTHTRTDATTRSRFTFEFDEEMCQTTAKDISEECHNKVLGEQTHHCDAQSAALSEKTSRSFSPGPTAQR